jgi:hypothetical protein
VTQNIFKSKDIIKSSYPALSDENYLVFGWKNKTAVANAVAVADAVADGVAETKVLVVNINSGKFHFLKSTPGSLDEVTMFETFFLSSIS